MAARRRQPVAESTPAVHDDGFQQAEAAGIGVSDRCEVSPGGRRGTVRQHADWYCADWSSLVMCCETENARCAGLWGDVLACPVASGLASSMMSPLARMTGA